jgi:ATP-binding cassette subfamily B protein IrtB
MVLSVLLRAAGTVLLIPLVTALFSDTPSDAWTWVAALTAATLAGWFTDWHASRLGQELGFGLLTGVPLSWFTSENTSAARQAIAATGPELVGIFAYLITPLLQALVLPIAIGLALLPVSVPLGLVALAGTPLLLGAMWGTMRISREADHVAEQSNASLSERLLEFARTQQALRAARRVEPAASHAGKALAAQHGANMRLLLLQIPGQVLFSLATQIALIALAATAIILNVRGELSIPQTVALIAVVARYIEPFAALGDLTPALESAKTTVDRISQVLNAPQAEGSGRERSTESQGVVFEDVTFGYESNDPVLSGFSATFEAGTTTAIVGPSGSGKSTVLGLAAGLNQPTTGRILVDGHDLWSCDGATRRELVSVVFQNPYLFEGTIEQNVRVGHPEADDATVQHAVEIARVHDIAAQWDTGLNTQVGEGGRALSGGERQRVSIARALLKPSRVLLIDEATSSLDTENEAAIVAALHDDSTSDLQDTHGEAIQGSSAQTKIVVTHRLSTIAGADRVLFLADGCIVEDGTVAELLDHGGLFAQFWQQQNEAAHWQLTRTHG